MKSGSSLPGRPNAKDFISRDLERKRGRKDVGVLGKELLPYALLGIGAFEKRGKLISNVDQFS
jgi:hypothetical protein